jgi:hypothetical protein
MRNSLLMKTSMSVLLVVSIAANCEAQSKAPHTAAASCSAPLTIANFKSHAAVMSSATSVAKRMLGEYNLDKTTIPNLNNMWNGFNADLLAASVLCTPPSPQAQKDKSTAKAKTAQTNKQNGAPSASDGSTSIAQKVGIPELLGVAVENGAITNNVSGTTMTLSSTPYGFFSALGKDKDTQSNYNRFQFYTQAGVSATFNVANSSDALESVTRKQISQWQAKVTFRDTSVRSHAVNDLYGKELDALAGNWLADLTSPDLTHTAEGLRDSTNQVYLKGWNGSLKPIVAKSYQDDSDNAEKAADIAAKLVELLAEDSAYQEALAAALDRVKGSGSLTAIVEKYIQDEKAYSTAEKQFEKDVKNLAKGWNGDLSFNEKFPTTTTKSSTSTTASASAATSAASTPATPAYLAGELDVTCEPRTEDPSSDKRGSGKQQKEPCSFFAKSTFTGNFSGSFYPNPNLTLKEQTFRGVQSAVQLQWDLGPGLVKTKTANDDSKMTLAFSSNYERLQENKDQKGKRPDIVLGNIKLEIPISSGVSFPLSFTVANSSEQVKETYVKGNFGISFDLDKLSALLKAREPTQ